MTRTARATFPRAANRDRSESKSGLDKSLRKGGAGGHNWGSLADERDLEYAALRDEEGELEEVGTLKTDNPSPALSDSAIAESKPHVPRSSSSLSNEEVQSNLKLRKNVFKNGSVDLSDIARSSSAVSASI